MADSGSSKRERSAALAAMKRRLSELERLEGRQSSMEAALRDSEGRFRFLYEQNPSMYFTVDVEGTVQSVNPFGAEQLGYDVADLVGKSVLDVFHPEDRDAVRQQLQTCIGDPGKAFSWELRKVHRDGCVLWVREIARAVHDRDDNIVVLVVCEDITGRRAVEEELRRARDEMERRVAERTGELRESQRELRLLAGRLLTAQEDERRRLAREMHDDLSQRIRGFALQAENMARREKGLSPSGEESVRALAARLSALANDVHALSRRLHPAMLKDLGLVSAVEAECAAFGEQGRVQADFQAEGVPETVDPETALCLYRITQEALRNVAKHAATDRARVRLTAEGDVLELTVADDGQGFDAQRVRGVGLGLASMLERARYVHADFGVESRPGAGTVVRVRVPLRRGQPRQ